MILKSYTTHDVETLAKTGVYAIVNKVNHKFYIGSATQVGKFPSQSGFNTRFYFHIYNLNKATHHCPHLQASWNKYGAESFEFQIIHLCSPEECLEFEQLYINMLCPHYNACPKAGSSRGVKRSKEYLERQSLVRGLAFEIVSPEGELIKSSNFAKFCKNRDLHASDFNAVFKGKSLHHRGWTKSLTHHKLFKDIEKMRGIRFEKSRSKWLVECKNSEKFKRVKRFNTLEEATSYRDLIENETDRRFTITLLGWKEKLKDYASKH